MTEQKRGYAQAEATAILEAAPERIAAPCRHYGLCGGCSYQHAEYAAQLALKRGILEETLQRAGVTAPKITVHSAEPWGYRNRIRMHFTREDGRLRLGYKQRKSNTTFAIAECPIAAPVLVRAALALADVLQDSIGSTMPPRRSSSATARRVRCRSPFLRRNVRAVARRIFHRDGRAAGSRVRSLRVRASICSAEDGTPPREIADVGR